MRRFHRSLLVFAAVLSLLSGLAGCGAAAQKAPTVQSLLEEVQANTDKLHSMETFTDATIEMSGTALESLGGSLSMGLKMNMETTTDPIANHLTGTLSALIMNTEIENYTIVNDNEIVNYISTAGTWMKQSLPYDAEAAESLEASAGDFLKHADSLSLAEETQVVDGENAYIITGTIKGEDVMELMGAAADIVGSYTGAEQIDLSGLTVDIEYAISADSKMPIYTKMDFGGMEAMTGTDEVKIDHMTMDMTYTGFDTVDSITVPQDVIDSAQEINLE